jgi:hypothetical protein
MVDAIEILNGKVTEEENSFADPHFDLSPLHRNRKINVFFSLYFVERLQVPLHKVSSLGLQGFVISQGF